MRWYFCSRSNCRTQSSHPMWPPSTDINECLQLPTPCVYQCHNLQGSYRCLCPPGQSLLRDGRTCSPLERSSQNITTVSHRSPFASWLRSRIPRPNGSYHAWVSLRPGSGALSSMERAWCPPGFIRQDGVCTGKAGSGHTHCCPELLGRAQSWANSESQHSWAKWDVGRWTFC